MYFIQFIFLFIPIIGGEYKARYFLWDLSPEVSLDAYVFYIIKVHDFVTHISDAYSCQKDASLDCFENFVVLPNFPSDDTTDKLTPEDVFDWTHPHPLPRVLSFSDYAKTQPARTLIDHVVALKLEEGVSTRNKPIEVCEDYSYTEVREVRKNFRHATQIFRGSRVTYQSHQCIHTNDHWQELIPYVMSRLGNATAVYFHHFDKWNVTSAILDPVEDSKAYWQIRNGIKFSENIISRAKRLMEQMESPIISMHLEMEKRALPVKMIRQRMNYLRKRENKNSFFLVSDRKSAFNKRLQRAQKGTVLAEQCAGREPDFLCRATNAYVASQAELFYGMERSNFSRWVQEERDRNGFNLDPSRWLIHCPKRKSMKRKKCYGDPVYLRLIERHDKDEL